MEFIIILIIIAVFVSILTGNLGYILFGATAFLLAVCGLMVLVFIPCVILLLFSKWKEATFLRLELPTEKSKFKVAVYLVEGEEIPCLFPEEGVFRKFFYKKDKTYHVLFNRKIQRVFDRFAICTCILGIVCGSLMGAILISLYF